MISKDRNIILDIVEKINQEIREDIGYDIDDFSLEFISDGCSGIILFLGIEVWNEDELDENWIGYQDTREFQESFTNFIWEKIKYIERIVCKITQYRKRNFNFKPNP